MRIRLTWSLSLAIVCVCLVCGGWIAKGAYEMQVERIQWNDGFHSHCYGAWIGSRMAPGHYYYTCGRCGAHFTTAHDMKNQVPRR